MVVLSPLQSGHWRAGSKYTMAITPALLSLYYIYAYTYFTKYKTASWFVCYSFHLIDKLFFFFFGRVHCTHSSVTPPPTHPPTPFRQPVMYTPPLTPTTRAGGGGGGGGGGGCGGTVCSSSCRRWLALNVGWLNAMSRMIYASLAFTMSHGCVFCWKIKT